MAGETKYQSVHTGAEIDSAISDIKSGLIEGFKNVAEESAASASRSAETAVLSAQSASSSAEKALQQADRVVGVAVKTPYLSANSTWMVWNEAQNRFIDSGVSGVGANGTKGDKGDMVYAFEIGADGVLSVVYSSADSIPPLVLTGNTLYFDTAMIGG